MLTLDAKRALVAQSLDSPPVDDLPGAFLEAPESSVAILDFSGYHHRPFFTGRGS